MYEIVLREKESGEVLGIMTVAARHEIRSLEEIQSLLLEVADNIMDESKCHPMEEYRK